MFQASVPVRREQAQRLDIRVVAEAGRVLSAEQVLYGQADGLHLLHGHLRPGRDHQVLRDRPEDVLGRGVSRHL